MRISGFLLLMFFALPAVAGVEAFIQFLSGPVQGPEALFSCFEQNEIEWGSDHRLKGPQKIQCPSDWHAKDTFFDLAYYHCQVHYGKSAQTCVELDAAKVKPRLENQALLTRMKNFTSQKFHTYRQQLAAECCQGKPQCLQRFQRTELKIVESPKSQASYLSDSSPSGRSIIEVTTAKLASAMNEENIERVLLVELAHACQFSLISESTEAYSKFTYDKCSVESGRLMFHEGLGEEMASCLDKELQSQIAAIPSEKRSNYCFGKWYREAFSDMKFRKHFTSIYHWTYDFLRRSQHTNYASVYRYLHCGMEQKFKSQVCK